MTDVLDERNGVALEADAPQERDRTNRTRTILAAFLVVLMILLAALGFFIFRILAPVGAPDDSDVSSGLEWVRSIYGYGPSQEQQFYRPTDAAVGPDGTIWGVDPQRARVLAFDPNGTFDTLLHQGPPGLGPNRMLSPEGIAVSEDNEIYVCDYGGNKMMVFSPDNVVLREWDVPLPTEVAVRDGRVAVTTRYGVALFTTEGELLLTLGEVGTGPEQFDIPHGIAFAEDGTLYVSDTHNERIKAYSPEGELLWITTGAGADPDAGDATDGEGASLFALPAGLTVDGSGRLVLVDPFDFSIIVISPEGEIVERYGEYGQSDGRFIYPTGIDYDAARDWFVVADTTNDRLQIVRIEGSATNQLLPALRRLGGPLWLCAIPLILLLIAVILWLSRRRRRADEYLEQEDVESGTVLP